jgi:cell wall-associated NlpC family hydrolase
MTPELVASYFGKPWASGARGPDAFDCWGLVRDVYAKAFNVDLPEFPGLDAESPLARVRMAADCAESPLWQAIPAPEHGCAVGMATNARISHVGVFCGLDGGFVLHTVAGSGVRLESLSQLKARGQKITFFKYHDADSNCLFSKPV